VEYEALNENFHNRGKRQEEQVALMRELWKSTVVDFHGKYHNVTLAGLKPLPGRQIPIWFGGGNEAVLKRAARLGDGYMPLFAPNDDGKAAMARLRGYLAEAGRDPSSFGIEGFTNIGAEPEKWGTHLESWREMGATHVSVRTMGAGLATPQAQIDAIRRYKAEAG
jgi:alkanesulfonate monooxygenase SsuD/methylene tetrahydromethanopterin reductase-like flavin-dependent oxidoreductase (luciferase family)